MQKKVSERGQNKRSASHHFFLFFLLNEIGKKRRDEESYLQDSEETGGRVKRDTIGRPMVYSPFIDEAVSIFIVNKTSAHTDCEIEYIASTMLKVVQINGCAGNQIEWFSEARQLRFNGCQPWSLLLLNGGEEELPEHVRIAIMSYQDLVLPRVVQHQQEKGSAF